MRRPDLEGLHAAHREPCHGAVLAVGDGAEVGVDFGDRLPSPASLRMRQSGWPSRCRSGSRRAAPGLVANPLFITIDHGHGLLLRDQVVENELRAAGVRPFGFVFARAVLQVEHRVARARVGIVPGGR